MLQHPQHSSSPVEPLKDLMKQAIECAPRVGKRILEDGILFDAVQQLFPDHQLRVVELCKGADRFRKPPIKLTSREAPLRKTIGIHRHDQEIFQDPQWIMWENLSNRKLCEKSPPSRLMMTIFAKDRHEIAFSKRAHDTDDEDSQNKRYKTDSQPTESPENRQDIQNIPNLQKNPTELDQLAHSVQGHGPKFLALKAADRQWISKIHHNLGHPNATKLKAIVQQQGYNEDIVQAISDFHCSICHESRAPRISRPAVLSDVREFNDCVGCDLVTWTSKSGRNFSFLHCVDSATNFQTGIPINRTDADALIDAISDCWFHWAGPCKQLVIDNESALCSEKFTQMAQSRDIHLRVVASYAHWQMGKTERHGDIIQHMLSKIDLEIAINHDGEFKEALQQACCAKNALSRAHGYTPEILVLGKSRPLPGSVSEDPSTAANHLADSDTPEGIAFRHQLQKREIARKAFLDADHSEKLRRAFLRRQRPHRGHFASGVFVMFWRPGVGEAKGQWTGPARIIIQESEHIVWISFASRVFRVAPEHVRLLSEREAQQQMPKLSQGPIEPLPKTQGRGVFQFEDLSDQVIPVDQLIPQTTNIPAQNNTDAAPSIDINAPDSEPDPPPSISDAPTTPLSTESPEPNPENSNPIEPSEVPIPESSDEDLIAEDFWVQQCDKLIRVHQKPRVQAFDPSTCSDCPIDLLTIGDERTTMGNYPQQEIWNHHDQWGNDQSSWNTDQPWTGITVFAVVSDAGCSLEDTHDIYHLEEHQGFACEIFLTEDDISQIAKQPEDFSTFVASAVKRQRVEVKLRDLNPEELQEFQNAKTKEIDQWLSTSTVRKILKSKIPEENILRCRWVLTWKDLDAVDAAKEGKNKKAKARLVVLGFEDPDITNIPRDSPTLQKESRSLLLQMCASKKWTIKSFDIKTAFLRGSRRDNRLLAVEPPQEMRERMQLKETEVCELLKSAYGLVNAPYLWYQELKESLLSLGFCMSPLDPCLFSLPSEDGQTHGLLGVHVDDGLCCGDQIFDQAIQKLEIKYPFGSKRSSDFTFTGIHIHQDQNFNIHLDQHDYIQAIDPIHIDRNRRKTEQTTVNEAERQGLRGLIGSLQYAATNSRPDVSARLSFLQSRINCAVIHDLLEANRLLGDAKKFSNTKVTITSIPLEQVRLMSYSDASFATREKKQSQKGGIVLAVHEDIAKQRSAKASTLVWYSKKIDRVVASALAAETYALSSAVDLLDWMRLAWEWIKCPTISWKKPEEVWKNAPPSISVIDCKSLYDVITKNTTPQCQEHRTLIEALVIKEHLQVGIHPHWVHSAAQLADCLTKTMDCYRLREFLKHCSCCLHDVEETLKERADRKAQKMWLTNQSQSDHSNTGPTGTQNF